jgi:asparagine synthase (glutamine-hydrolysing)
MRDAMIHRGPDDAGAWVGGPVGLGSRRLSILDLSAKGRMPMATPDGRYRIVYNGEVYNFRELRREMESRGVGFMSDTDTEVVLQQLAAFGPAALTKFNGMFALALWDESERSLLLARDRLGVKPLYYAWHKGDFLFASEEKALFAAGMPAEMDPEVLGELFCFRYVAGEKTPFRGVRRLLPGHFLVLKDGTARTTRWWDLRERARAIRDEAREDGVAWYRDTFDDAVALRRIADVPVGVMLSGGLDSSSVAASAALQAGSGVESFTVAFDEAGFDESAVAKTVVDRYRLHWHRFHLSAAELHGQMERATYFSDEPLAHGNDVHMLALAQLAKPRVTVLLSGEGADETLGGYVRYRPLLWPGMLRAARPLAPALRGLGWIPHRPRKLIRFLSLPRPEDVVVFNASDVLPDEWREVGLRADPDLSWRDGVLEEAREIWPDEPMRQAMYLDQLTFLVSLLDRNDRMTMGASIECRTPFLDYRLVEGAASIPTEALRAGNRPKGILVQAQRDRLPAEVLAHRKWGFGVPWKQYLREDRGLREEVLALAKTPELEAMSVNRPLLDGAMARFLAGDDSLEAIVKQLLMFRTWTRSYFPAVRRLAEGPTGS